MVGMLLLGMEPNVYKLLKDIIMQDKPNNKTHKQLCQQLVNDVSPKPLVITEWFKLRPFS